MAYRGMVSLKKTLIPQLRRDEVRKDFDLKKRHDNLTAENTAYYGLYYTLYGTILSPDGNVYHQEVCNLFLA